MKIKNLILGLLLIVVSLNANALSVFQNNPLDNSWDNDRVVYFNCSGTTDATLVNISLYIDGVLNATNSSIDQQINQTVFMITFSTDSCNGRKWYCEVCDNTSSCNQSVDRTIRIDATPPTVICDAGNDYYSIRQGQLVLFTDSDACGISSRKWSNDDGTTYHTNFVETNDVDTHGWERKPYIVELTSCDMAGNCANARCYLSQLLRERTYEGLITGTEQQYIDEAGNTLNLGQQKDNGFLVIIVSAIALLLVVGIFSKGTRVKKRR